MLSLTIVLFCTSLGIVAAVLIAGIVIARGEDHRMAGSVEPDEPPPNRPMNWDRLPADLARAMRREVSASLAKQPDVDDERR